MSDCQNENGRAEEIGAPAGAREKSVEFDVDVHQDAEAEISATPSFQNASLLDDHARAGHELIPLRHWKAKDAAGKPAGKEPVGRWRLQPSLTLPEAAAHMKAGKNVGVRLRSIDLVIDVDPRYFAEGDDPLARLIADFGLPDAPFVLTGGGGRHLYFRKPAEIAIVHELATYPGIEFASLGRYVVAAGSVHPNGTPYRLDDDPLARSLSEAPEATTALLDAIRKPSVKASTDAHGEIEPEQLERLLSRLDVTAYNGRHDGWLAIMMASHHGTAGDGIDEFVAWSVSDPEYTNDEADIRRRWQSLGLKPNGVRLGTLLKALSDAGHGAWIEEVLRSPAEEDFADDHDGEPLATPESSASAVWNEWVWVVEPYQFFRRSDTHKLRTDQWKSLFAHLRPEGDVLNAVWKNNLRLRKFETLVYLPETVEFPDGENGGRYNIWRRSGVKAKEGDVSVFLDHMAHLFPDEGDRNHVLDYLALLVQQPAEKIHFALLIRGAQGTGKSWIGILMERIVGRRNAMRPSNDEVISRWTAWMEGAQLAIIEELMTLGRKEVANRLKPAITDATLRIEQKGCSIYSIPNCLNFLCFTNHDDALPIEHGDRRWLVVFSPAKKRDEAYYDRLFGYLDSGGAAHVKHWLAKRQVSLNPHGVAPSTVGKETMRRLGMGDAEAYLLDLFDAASAPFDFDLVRLDDVVAAVPAALRGRSNLRARVSKMLKNELGAIEHTRYTKGDGKRPAMQLWSVRSQDAWDKVGAAGRIDAFTAHRSAASLD